MKYKYKLGFIGGGNMAKAILNGILNNALLNKNDIIVSDPFLKDNLFGVEVVNDNSIVFQNCEFTLFAIKPQIFNEIAPTFGKIESKYIVTIMAGVKSEKIKQYVGDAEVIRIMPNTPCSVGKGMSAISINNSSATANNFVKNMFECIGKVTYLEEKYFDAVTSVSGSGPAYVYYFIQAMINGGIKGGLDFETSKLLTLQTFEGACKMIEHSDEDIDVLIEKVCSKGGTTIQAVQTFRQNNVSNIIEEGIEKCRIRSEELSK
ncbi:MAG: pyrroline-5-carboxylate reductase [Clostridia bacterium]